MAEYDPLVDEGIAYAEKLRGAGNAVTLKVAQGMVHGFYNFGGFSAAARAEVDQTVVALRRAFD